MSKKRRERQAREDRQRELEHAQWDAMRASVGAKFGDGLELYKKMREGSPVQRELAKIYAGMSADQADAMLSLYASNPLLKLLITATPDLTNVSPFTKRVRPKDAT